MRSLAILLLTSLPTADQGGPLDGNRDGLWRIYAETENSVGLSGLFGGGAAVRLTSGGERRPDNPYGSIRAGAAADPEPSLRHRRSVVSQPDRFSDDADSAERFGRYAELAELHGSAAA